MAATVESSIEQQQRLVRDISHELRSPLTRLQIALALARQKQDSSELDRIEKEADRLNDLIGQLLTLPDDTAPLEDTIDLIELIESIIDDSKIEASINNIELILLTDNGNAVKKYGDQVEVFAKTGGIDSLLEKLKESKDANAE